MMKGAVQIQWVLSLLLLPLGCLTAQEDFRVYPYLQHPTPEAMTIRWFSEEQAPGLLQWWELGSDQEATAESDPVPAESLAYPVWEDTTFFGGAAPSYPYLHHIRLENLTPATTYGYTVTQGSGSFTASFQTAPPGNDSLRFIVYADAETEPESTGNHTVWVDPVTTIWRSYLVDQTTGYRNNLEIIRQRQPALVLIAGDLVQMGGEQRDWDEFWRHNTDSVGENSTGGQIPMLTAPGNHEYYEGGSLDKYNQPGSERAMGRYLTYFEFPENLSPDPEQEGRYYSLKYGPATFIILDLCNNSPNESEEDTNFYLLGENDPEGGHAPDFGEGSRQYSWLEEQLGEAQQNSLFTFLMFHHVPYSSGPHGFPPGIGDSLDNQSGVPVRVLTPLFMQYGVDAVFCGHDEMWERSMVTGTEELPDGSLVEHSIHYYDVGTGGDGLRGPEGGTDNQFQEFLVHTDVPEVWEGDTLVEGGKHYGHLEVDIFPQDEHTWTATLKPVYSFPLFSKEDSAYTEHERRVYDDLVILTRYDSVSTLGEDLHPITSLKASTYPNPFKSEVNIGCMLPESCEVTIIITDALGRIIREDAYGIHPAGHFRTTWDGMDNRGTLVSPGTYYLRLITHSGQDRLFRAVLIKMDP